MLQADGTHVDPKRTRTYSSRSTRGQYPSFYAADPLELPSGMTLERDLEDVLMERALRFYQTHKRVTREKCFLVGVELKQQSRESTAHRFTLEESMTELSELAGTAGLEVLSRNALLLNVYWFGLQELMR
jgi:hypothetical protein